MRASRRFAVQMRDSPAFELAEVRLAMVSEDLARLVFPARAITIVSPSTIPIRGRARRSVRPSFSGSHEAGEDQFGRHLRTSAAMRHAPDLQ